MKDPKVGIVIVTYNSESVIKECLKSIFANNYPSMEVVVVDNASSDKTVPTIRKYFKKVHIITSKTNTGFGSANNMGIKYLLKRNSKYILLLNPDTISSPGLVKELINPFSQDKKIGITGCIITYQKNAKKIWFAGGYFNQFFCFTRHSYMDRLVSETIIRSRSVDFITGACMMIKAEVIRKAGFMPEEYFLYFEDVFYCQKIRRKGFSCYLISQPLVSHRTSTSTGIAQTNIMTPLRAYYFARNPLLYIRKNVNGILRLTNFLGQFCIRFPYYAFQTVKAGDMKALTAYFRGIFDGLFRGSSSVFLNNE